MKLQISISLSSESGVVQLTQCEIDMLQAPDIAAMGVRREKAALSCG